MTRPPTTRKKKKPDWAKIRAEFEAGASINGLANKYRVPVSTVQYHQKKEEWLQNLTQSINRQAEEKLVGISASDNPEKRAAAIAEEASRKTAVLARHRDEMNVTRKLVYDAIKAKDFELAKLAKISTETLAIIHTCERKAWGLNDPIQQAPDTGQQQERTQTAMVAINNLLSQIVIEKHGSAGHGQAPRPKD